jgi:hypothetical protein
LGRSFAPKHDFFCKIKNSFTPHGVKLPLHGSTRIASAMGGRRTNRPLTLPLRRIESDKLCLPLRTQGCGGIAAKRKIRFQPMAVSLWCAKIQDASPSSFWGFMMFSSDVIIISIACQELRFVIGPNCLTTSPLSG